MINKLILIFIIIGLIYSCYMVFSIRDKNSKNIILFEKNAIKMDKDLFIKRRLYALEFWIIFISLVIFLKIN